MRYFLIIANLLFFGFAYGQDDIYQTEAYESRISKVFLNGVYIPENIVDALKELDKKVEPEGRKAFAALTEEEAASKLFFSFGRWMMVNWGMEEGSRISHYFRQQGVGIVEDMVRILMVTYHRHIHQRPIALEQLIEQYNEMRKKELEQKRKELLKSSKKLEH